MNDVDLFRKQLHENLLKNFYYSKDSNIDAVLSSSDIHFYLFNQSKFEHLGFIQSDVSVNLYWARYNNLSISEILRLDNCIKSNFELAETLSSDILKRCEYARENYISLSYGLSVE